MMRGTVAAIAWAAIAGLIAPRAGALAPSSAS